MDPKRQPLKSSMVKSGKRNFFFDVYLAANQNKYIRITESKVPEKEGEPGKRQSFVLFAEDIKNFQSTMTELAAHLI